MIFFAVLRSNNYCDSLHATRSFAIRYLTFILLIVYACLHALSCFSEDSATPKKTDRFHFAYMNMLVGVFFFGVIVYVYVDGVDCHKEEDDIFIYIGGAFISIHAVIAAWFVKLDHVYASRDSAYIQCNEAKQQELDRLS
jgi:hypothetical protein